ncbi:DUF2975 domain-containing protein [Marivirga sp. S37H4]|uniref:DUF2975 domain-containing protein n=1 Tax=Marivirga aurantiaca TaxID=2802615 RepID=A0A935C5Q8_9BACT|nr:DUF2975 domain-containing protein [Marivirga aurantiaca]MBK6263950.1 DUF2975 domain-containing protein [Marivirga aurantiaca]
MEIKITTQQILKVLQILSWLIFIGLCIEAGGIAVNTFITLVINPLGANNFWEGADLSRLYDYDSGHFFVITFTMTIVAVLKAIMFYLIVKLFTEKKLNLSQPFSLDLRRFMLQLSYLALAIGLFSYSGINYYVWLTKQGLKTADLQSLHMAGADVWLFMAVILFVIAQIVKRGIEIQSENELTV